MRGSVWVKVRVWIVNRDGSLRKSSGEQLYSYSAVDTINTEYQRQMLYEKALNKALATYRNNHGLESDEEVNYHLLNSGVQRTSEKVRPDGTHKQLEFVRLKLSTKRKRESHKIVNTGGDIKEGVSIRHEYAKSEEIPIDTREKTEEQYMGRKTKDKDEKIVINTGYIHLKKSKKQ